jgi:hypothetical protein
MPTYTWLQAIRVLAGLEPGHPYLPSMEPPVPECDPPRVKELLADGVATVEGIPHDGDLHEPIPAAAWRRIRIGFFPSETTERPLWTVAILPGRFVPDLTASRTWRDLLISADGVHALKAAAEGLVHPAGANDTPTLPSGDAPGATGRKHTLKAERNCLDYLKELMSSGSDPEPREVVKLRCQEIRTRAEWTSLQSGLGHRCTRSGRGLVDASRAKANQEIESRRDCGEIVTPISGNRFDLLISQEYT